MQEPNDAFSRLYDAREYELRPDTYHPKGIDAVAAYLKEKFALEGLPPIGLVRHVISNPESGLERLIKERHSETPESKLKRRIDKHAPEVRKLLTDVLTPRAPEPVKREPYHGPQPIRTVEFGDEMDSEFAEFLKTRLEAIRAEALMDPPSLEAFDEIVEYFGDSSSEIADGVRKQLEAMRERFKSSDKTERDALSLFGNTYGIFNNTFLLGRGQMLTCNDALKDGVGISRVHEIHVYDSPKGEIGVAYLSPLSDTSGMSSPCYDTSTDIVRIGAGFMAREVHQAATHGYNNDHANAISDALGDYRYGRLERDFYRNLWQRYGNRDLLMRLAQDFVAEKDRDGYTLMNKVRTTQLFKAQHSSILSEEMRHAIDIRQMHDAYRQHGGSAETRPLRSAAIFGSGSEIRDGFLGITQPGNDDEVEMLMSAIDELVAKMTATAVSIDPQLMIAHFRYVTEQSRIAGKNRVQTFRDDLASVHTKEEEALESWPHALGAKMSATIFGRHLGFLKRDFHLDAEYDHIELLNTLDKVGRLPPEKIRLAVRDTMNPQLIIPVDCKPFRKIDDDGYMVPQEDAKTHG